MKFTIAITLTKCLYVTTEFKNGDLHHGSSKYLKNICKMLSL